MKKSRIKSIMVMIFFMDFVLILLLSMNCRQKQTYKEESSIANINSVEREGDFDTKLDVIVSTETEDVVDFHGKQDDSIKRIFEEQIVGKYVINDIVRYEFKGDGLFSGFFDITESNVNDFYYEIVVSEDVPYVYIYNKEKTKVVSYEVLLDSEKNIILYYQAANLKIELRK